jgi:Tfp pilus assembly protein PilX
MNPSPSPQERAQEHGGITIVVVLMLLVLLTIASLAMSKSAIRAGITSGTLRQATQAQNLSDAGLEWGIFWLAPDTNPVPQKPNPTGGALALYNLALQEKGSLSLGSTSAPLTSSDFTILTTANATQSFSLTLTYMGQLTSFGSTSTSSTSTTALSATSYDFWNIRSDGQVTYTGGPTFTHRREVWVSMPTLQQR